MNPILIVFSAICLCVVNARHVAPKAFADPVYQECGKTASCFGLPKDCVASGNCDFFFRSTYNKAADSFLFELVSSASYVTDTYMAVGFSEKNKMSGIAVECYTWKATNKVGIDYSFNSYDKIGTNTRIDDPSKVTGFSDPKAELKDGRLQCQWTVSKTGLVKYSDHSYDFDHNSFYLLLAKGKMTSETQISSHHKDNLVSASQVDLTKAATISF